MNIEAALKQVSFLSQLSDDQIERLARGGHTAHYDAGAVIFRENDTAESMYLVQSGIVNMRKLTEEGEDIDLGEAREGDVFGELALLDSHPRTSSAIAMTDADLFILDQISFMSLLLTSRSQVVYRVFSALISRIREIDDRFMRTELERQRLEDSMKIEQLRTLSQMVTGVAHEINTPLGVINTAASIIDKSLRSDMFASVASTPAGKSELDDVFEALDLMQRSIQRAHRLTQDFKKVSASQLSDTKEELDLIEGLDEVLNLYSLNARRANLEIQVHNHLEDGKRLWIGYRGYLSQVLLNLLTNIERYAYPNGGGGKVDLTVRDGVDSKGQPIYSLTVRDHGVGIPEENLPKLFEPFFTTGRMKGGTGLGLAIVHNIVTSALQGQIKVTSNADEGTAFTISFPQVIP